MDLGILEILAMHFAKVMSSPLVKPIKCKIYYPLFTVPDPMPKCVMIRNRTSAPLSSDFSLANWCITTLPSYLVYTNSIPFLSTIQGATESNVLLFSYKEKSFNCCKRISVYFISTVSILVSLQEKVILIAIRILHFIVKVPVYAYTLSLVCVHRKSATFNG